MTTPSPIEALRKVATEFGVTSDSPEVSGTEAIHNTDMGNALRFAKRHGQDLRYCPPWKAWLVWDGRRWAQDNTVEVQRLAKETIAALHLEAALLQDEDERTALQKHAVRSEADTRVRAAIELAHSEQGIPVRPEAFDMDLWALNTPSGTLDLKTGELHPHRREDLITKITAAAYDPDARLPEWDAFISDICDGDPQLASFLQQAVGASLSGDLSRSEEFFFAYGPKVTGKSTFLEAVSRTLGGYAATADFETFLKRQQIGGPRSDLARLRGARFVKSIEVSEGRHLAEGLLKQLTGGDTITVRELYSKEFEFVPQFTLWLAANDAPAVRSDDDALWRRLRRVPFNHEFSNPNPDIKLKLMDPGIAGAAVLRWAVEGCQEWQQAGGIVVPEAVRQSTADYQTESDPLVDFIEDECFTGPDCAVSANQLYKAYGSWASEQGITERRRMTNTRFGKLITQRFGKSHTRSGRLYTGVRLRTLDDTVTGP